MNKIIFETVSLKFFKILNKKKTPLFWLKGFYAFHHKGKIRFSPPSCPDFVERQIKKGIITVIDSSKFRVDDIYLRSGELAVDTIDKIWPFYFAINKSVVNLLSTLVKSDHVHNAFKKELCDKLGQYYSINIILNRISILFPKDKIEFYSTYKTSDYHQITELLKKANIQIHHPFNIELKNNDFFLRCILFFIKRYGKALTTILFLLGCSCIKFILSKPRRIQKQFIYGINLNTTRQLRNNERGPHFFLNKTSVNKNNSIVISTIKLDIKQIKGLEDLQGENFISENYRCYLFASFAWLAVLPSLVFGFKKRPEEYEIVLNVLGQYIKWKNILKHITFKTFISHCDFSIGHIGRNLALRENKIKTLYFTDSMNSNCNFFGFIDEKTKMRHPFWTYLEYDHFITWTKYLAQYITSHPGSKMKTDVVGCIWSSHIQDKKVAINKISASLSKSVNGYKIVGVFDTTYTRNGFTSYQEGIQFAKDIFTLVQENQNIFIIFKTKKDDWNHIKFDPENGPRLLSLYSEMDMHQRICFFSNQYSASDIIASSDLVISFPFTSTTFETLSANRKAVWHDPFGLYKNTPYGKLPGITTNGYLQLKDCVQKIVLGQELHQSMDDSLLMDVFHDGKAIDRFRMIMESESEV